MSFLPSLQPNHRFSTLSMCLLRYHISRYSRRHINVTTIYINYPSLQRSSTSPCHVSSVLTQPDDPRLSCLGLPLTLPYEVETLAEMDDRLELIACRLVECVKAREWEGGFRIWDAALTMWVITSRADPDCSWQLDQHGLPHEKGDEGQIDFPILRIDVWVCYKSCRTSLTSTVVPGIGTTLIEEAGNQFIGLTRFVLSALAMLEVFPADTMLTCAAIRA